MKTTELHRMPI